MGSVSVWVHVWGLMSGSWLQIVQQNRLQVTQPMQWGLARSLTTKLAALYLSCWRVWKLERQDKDSEWLEWINGEERGNKNKTQRKFGCNLHTSFQKCVAQRICGFWGKLVTPERRKQRWLCRVPPRSRARRDVVMQMDSSRCKWWPRFFFFFFWKDSTYSEKYNVCAELVCRWESGGSWKVCTVFFWRGMWCKTVEVGQQLRLSCAHESGWGTVKQRPS